MNWQAIQVTGTAFLVLFSIVGLALWGLFYYYDFMVQQFGWTRAQVTSGNALSKLVVGPLFGFFAERAAGPDPISRGSAGRHLEQRLQARSVLSVARREHVFHSRGQRNPAEPKTFPDPRHALRARTGDSGFVARTSLQHGGPLAHGLVGRSISEKVRHAVDLPAGRRRHSLSADRPLAVPAVCLCDSVWRRAWRRLYDHPVAGCRAFRRASAWPIVGSHLDYRW